MSFILEGIKIAVVCIWSALGVHWGLVEGWLGVFWGTFEVPLEFLWGPVWGSLGGLLGVSLEVCCESV